MGVIADIFNQDAYSAVALTEAVNVIPNNYGRIRQSGLFKEKGITTTSVAIERQNNVLNLLPQTQRGGEASRNQSGKRQMVSIEVPNFTHEDTIMAADVLNVRAFNTENQPEAIQTLVNNKLAEMRNKHDITLEFMCAGALKGKVLNSDGETIVDLFKAFGIQQKIIDFKFSTAGTAVDALCRDVHRHIEKNLKGEMMNGVLALCSPEYFDMLLKNESVKEAYDNYQSKTPWRDDMRQEFIYQGVKFSEYVGEATNVKGDVFKFVPEGEAIFLPMGTTNTFEINNAPADYIDAVGTIGLPIYAKQEVAKFERGIDLQTQSNPLPICKRPEVLVRGVSTK